MRLDSSWAGRSRVWTPSTTVQFSLKGKALWGQGFPSPSWWPVKQVRCPAQPVMEVRVLPASCPTCRVSLSSKKGCQPLEGVGRQFSRQKIKAAQIHNECRRPQGPSCGRSGSSTVSYLCVESPLPYSCPQYICSTFWGRKTNKRFGEISREIFSETGRQFTIFWGSFPFPDGWGVCARNRPAALVIRGIITTITMRTMKVHLKVRLGVPLPVIRCLLPVWGGSSFQGNWEGFVYLGGSILDLFMGWVYVRT